VGILLALLAGLLKLLPAHTAWIIPLLIVAVILIGAEVLWGWRRSGYYRRPG
jgi:hypothetical protein